MRTVSMPLAKRSKTPKRGRGNLGSNNIPIDVATAQLNPANCIEDCTSGFFIKVFHTS
jgi:hypothetical protein